MKQRLLKFFSNRFLKSFTSLIAISTFTVLLFQNCGGFNSLENSSLSSYHNNENSDNDDNFWNQPLDLSAVSSQDAEVLYNTSQAIPLSLLADASPGVNGQKEVVIQAHEIVYIDKSLDIGSLTINGELHCENRTPNQTEIKVGVLYVNGTFQCGTSQQAYNKDMTISLKHSPRDTASGAYRGFLVNRNGKLIFNGNKRNAGWYKLAENLQQGQSQLYLDTDVRGKWLTGDKIAVAPTSYNYEEAESFTILDISHDGRTIKLDRPARFLHWGRVQQLQAPVNGNVTLDQRAEVINLSRNIKIQSDESSGSVSNELGAHLMVNRGGFAAIDSVEFYKMGQAGVMARYPFHWHIVGDAHGQFIRNSSVHSSFQRCIVVHRTNHTIVENNVCYDFKGHGFFLEDGVEVNNILQTNVGILAKYPSNSKILLASDSPDFHRSGIDPLRFPSVSAFWISHPQNIVIHNVAAGSVGTGFWMAYATEIRNFNESLRKFEGAILARPQSTMTTSFSNNIAHSSLVGITWDGAPDTNEYGHATHPNDMNNPRNPMDRKIISSHYNPTNQTPIFNHLTAYKNLNAGIYYRGNTAIFNRAILADNGWSLFLAYNQVFRDSVVIGRSQNHSSIDDNFLYSSSRFLRKQAGIVMYDGPFELQRVDFLNFTNQNLTASGRDITPVPILQIGGARKFINLTSQVGFSPEPFRRIASKESSEIWLDADHISDLRDLDGSLTGSAGSLLVPAHEFTLASNCKADNRFSGFRVCPPSTQKMGLFFDSNDPHFIPFLAQRSDGALNLPMQRWDELNNVTQKRAFNSKLGLISSDNFEYKVLFKKSDLPTSGLTNLSVSLNAEKANSLGPVVEVAGLGSHCVLQSAKAVSSLQELRQSKSTAYYSHGNQFYFRLSTSFLNFNLTPNSQTLSRDHMSHQHRILCSQPNQPNVIGHVEGFVTENSQHYIKGWACASGETQSIQVHLYSGGPAGTGSFVKATAANLAHEPAVSFACGSVGKHHRFQIPISSTELTSLQNQPIYIHGIALTSGQDNALLDGSGQRRFPSSANPNPPSPPPSPPPTSPPTSPPPTTDPNKMAIWVSYRPSTFGYLYSPIQGEGTPYGFINDKIGFYIFTNSGQNRHLLYRCRIGGHHFLSIDSNCEGQIIEGPLGYLAGSSSSAAPHPLIRCRNKNTGRHLITISQQECNANEFIIEGTLGFTPP